MKSGTSDKQEVMKGETITDGGIYVQNKHGEDTSSWKGQVMWRTPFSEDAP